MSPPLLSTRTPSIPIHLLDLHKSVIREVLWFLQFTNEETDACNVYLPAFRKWVSGAHSLASVSTIHEVSHALSFRSQQCWV